jgi:hypothetical protein
MIRASNSPCLGEHSSGGTAEAGGDHQAGQPHAAGGSAAVSYDPQFRKEYLHRCHQKPKAVATVALGHTTVLDAAHAEAVSSRRSHREQPAGGPGRRELDRDLRKTDLRCQRSHDSALMSPNQVEAVGRDSYAAPSRRFSEKRRRRPVFVRLVTAVIIAD